MFERCGQKRGMILFSVMTVSLLSFSIAYSRVLLPYVAALYISHNYAVTYVVKMTLGMTPGQTSWYVYLPYFNVINIYRCLSWSNLKEKSLVWKIYTLFASQIAIPFTMLLHVPRIMVVISLVVYSVFCSNILFALGKRRFKNEL